MVKILIAEDEEPIANLIRMNLKKAGYACECAYDGQEAADRMEEGHYDLLLLDIMLPKINGYELMEYAKSIQLPVIFITAMDSTENKVKGLKMGAEDYLAKPFEIVELLARVEAVLRRCNKIGRMLHILDVDIDLSSRTVMQDNQQILLTLKEYELLLFFARNPNIALYREVIYEQVWEKEYTGDSRTVDLHVQRLKKKLGWDKHICAVYKIGYRLET
ncbi:MAG: response regulator transcription factor [Clostridiaceae bacterium]|jgi:DNA-binding response OmpR family regulator|uniref:Stage 0 sporulation protein A homolog n=1 Tax=Hominiventricola aquisgranensis TaxID=3133164 RepID=A0ABV1I3W3_9FIRM|nr:response regulator transcription factor [Clostridiaceae bacterium]MDY4547054.1 response regulator transcription factor [Candidatus Choladocola sp.]RGD95728.1 DNA-binding response regulator [Clostridiales bacterium AM23-16LB]RHO80888.1 DNA-binding response regulator [Clostridiaceae bacterium AF42-6]RHP51987.1 DNA-binding response regulator [Clostridiaceae bacterium AF31-3BH]RHQ25117.1 DNA-binding response regulator [Clostridiaceae bacterium AF29-16BH]RHR42311.1 DNA-binding response regulato